MFWVLLLSVVQCYRVRATWSLRPSPHTQPRSVSAGVRDRQRGEGVVEESRQAGKQRGGKKRECALVVSFAARLLPSALEKPVLSLLAQIH